MKEKTIQEKTFDFIVEEKILPFGGFIRFLVALGVAGVIPYVLSCMDWGMGIKTFSFLGGSILYVLFIYGVVYPSISFFLSFTSFVQEEYKNKIKEEQQRN